MPCANRPIDHESGDREFVSFYSIPMADMAGRVQLFAFRPVTPDKGVPGPMLPEALDRLIAEIGRVGR